MADINDLKKDVRVKRNQAERSQGTIIEIRTESGNDNELENKLVKVRWDNGTVSYLSPKALDVLQ